MERSIEEIYEHASEMIESLWNDENVPAHELETLIFALMHLISVDTESMTTIFDTIVRRYKTLKQMKAEAADNVIPFPAKQ